MNTIDLQNPDENIVESSFKKGTKENHTHVRFYINTHKTIVSRQMFIEHFPDRHKAKNEYSFLIKTKPEL